MNAFYKTLSILCMLFALGLCFSKSEADEKKDFWSVFHNLTDTDKQTLKNYESIYYKNLNKPSEKVTSIPKVVHFIWIGPKEFPKTSISNLESWINHNPEYTFNFWTDRVRPNLPSSIKTSLLDSFPLKYFQQEFNESNNYAEKSDLIRYELLLEKGGIYVDHDVECFQSFDTLLDKFDFFAGLEPPHIPLGDSMLTICNNIIGVKPNHPVLENTIKRIKTNWKPLRELYQGEKAETVKKRVFYSTFMPFSDAAKSLLESQEFHNIIFPPAYFNSIEDNRGVYTHHQYASTWFENETKFELLVRKRLIKIAKKSNLILLISSIFFVINVSLFIIVLIFLKKMKNRYLLNG